MGDDTLHLGYPIQKEREMASDEFVREMEQEIADKLVARSRALAGSINAGTVEQLEVELFRMDVESYCKFLLEHRFGVTV